MKDLDQLKYLFRLKEVERGGRVGARKESTAEHVWSTMLLAQYFQRRFDFDLDMLKVYEILLYHDLIEIESLDTFILDDNAKETQSEREKDASELIKENLPNVLLEEYSEIFTEFEELESREAEYVRAVDALEPMIHWLDYKEDWRESGFSEENLRRWKEKHLSRFPELLGFFNDLIDYLKSEDYID